MSDKSYILMQAPGAPESTEATLETDEAFVAFDEKLGEWIDSCKIQYEGIKGLFAELGYDANIEFVQHPTPIYVHDKVTRSGYLFRTTGDAPEDYLKKIFAADMYTRVDPERGEELIKMFEDSYKERMDALEQKMIAQKKAAVRTAKRHRPQLG